MLKTRIALAIGATAITGAAIYGADRYFSAVPESGEKIELAVTDDLSREAQSTGCGLRDAGFATEKKAAFVDESVTRARVVSSQSIGGEEDVAALIAAGDCRFRLDGVWQQDMVVGLDDSITPDIFEGSESDGLDARLSHATMTTPGLLLIEASNDGQELKIRDGLGDGTWIIARATDETPLADVFKIQGDLKYYRIEGGGLEQYAPDGNITVDVNKVGYVRVRVGDTNFMRPKPNVAQTPTTPSDDAWMIGFNLLNLDATRKGYDLYRQDMWDLSQRHGLMDIFDAADPTEYSIVEQRTVPLGYKYITENVQGSFTSTSLLRTESAYQRMAGWSAGGEVSGGQNPISGEAIHAVGGSYTESQTVGMRSASASSIMLGLARHKTYTIVLDQPFVRLSEDFVAAVEDVRRHGRYDEFIAKFGTHYPYAVTYGSAGMAVREFNEETVSNWNADDNKASVNAKTAIKGVGIEANGTKFEANESSNSFLAQSSYKNFKAIGGTGSWDESGHATGSVPAPILADLRPIYELLNPLNFPGEPEVYTEVRAGLRNAIDAYLVANARAPSDTINEMTRSFTLKPLKISCSSTGSEKRVELEGNLDFGVVDRKGKTLTEEMHVANWAKDRGGRLKLNCAKNGSANLAEYKRKSITVSGSLRELMGKNFAYQGPVKEYDWGSKDETLISGLTTSFVIPIMEMKVGDTEVVEIEFTHTTNKNTFVLTTEITRNSVCKADPSGRNVCPA
ncbi:MAC/perforin domain-containing protein [Erythrobacter sp. THAF29]|uniref:MAC/perforin domain-containing protein n=1 Tax=Erythrobacter sp. THAF29 TaxID=2587851 RepID=UPI00156211EA|nr:MAC/perforin domain-containing protein [Erythrobacter sp. THAF29]